MLSSESHFINGQYIDTGNEEIIDKIKPKYESNMQVFGKPNVMMKMNPTFDGP